MGWAGAGEKEEAPRTECGGRDLSDGEKSRLWATVGEEEEESTELGTAGKLA